MKLSYISVHLWRLRTLDIYLNVIYIHIFRPTGSNCVFFCILFELLIVAVLFILIQINLKIDNFSDIHKIYYNRNADIFVSLEEIYIKAFCHCVKRPCTKSMFRGRWLVLLVRNTGTHYYSFECEVNIIPSSPRYNVVIHLMHRHLNVPIVYLCTYFYASL